MSVQIVQDNKLQPIAGELNKTAVFAGQITMGANISAPYGWLLCDGTAYNIADYRSLFAAIGKTYNKPNTPEGQFCVPDMRNQFAMGAGSNPVGAKVEATLPNIRGEVWNIALQQKGLPAAVSGACIPSVQTQGISFGTGSDTGKDGFGFNAAAYNPIYKDGATVTPPSIALNYFIKY